MGTPTPKKLFVGLGKLAALEPWHTAQLVVLLGALAWIAAIVGTIEKSALVWQDEHFAELENGM